MTFLMGTWLLGIGLLSVSIPVIIHLLHRQKTTPVLWGAMMFLKESPLQMKRRKNVDHLLLLLIRMAILALLAWLLARPLWNTARLNPLAGSQPVDMAVVIDHSLSMGRRSGDVTLFDKACSVVDRLTDVRNPVLRNGDTLAVVLAEHQPRQITPVPLSARDVGNLTRVRGQLQALKPGTTDGSIPIAIEAAREVLRRGPNLRKVVLVVSDDQKTSWDVGETAAWQRAVGDPINGIDRGLEVHSYPLSPDTSVSNITVGEISFQPAFVGVNIPVQITATVSNSGPREVGALAVHLSVNGKEMSAAQQVPALGAGQSATVRFDHVFTQGGSAYVRVWTDAIDALQADNESVAALHVWDKLPVLIIDGKLSAAGGRFPNTTYLKIDMESVNSSQAATSLIKPKVLGVLDGATATLGDYYMVVLNDVPQLPVELQARLADYVTRVHGLWIIMGPRTTPAFIDSLATSVGGSAGLFRADLKSKTPRSEKTAPPIEIKDPNNPVVAVVAAGQRNALVGAVTQKWWAIAPRDPDTQVVLATTTGDPLILERALGRGRVAVWTTPVFNLDWNSWPLMPNIVPLVHETIYHLSSLQAGAHNSGNMESGTSLAWNGPALDGVQSVSVDVTLPDGSADRDRPATFRNGRWEFNYPNTFLPGLYQLRFAPTGLPQPVYYGVGAKRN